MRLTSYLQGVACGVIVGGEFGKAIFFQMITQTCKETNNARTVAEGCTVADGWMNTSPMTVGFPGPFVARRSGYTSR